MHDTAGPVVSKRAVCSLLMCFVFSVHVFSINESESNSLLVSIEQEKRSAYEIKLAKAIELGDEDIIDLVMSAKPRDEVCSHSLFFSHRRMV